MATAAVPGLIQKRDWRGALVALRGLLRDGNDTVQVFRIMRALNAGTGSRNYHRLLTTSEGGRIAYERVELSRRFMDPAYIAHFEAGTVGAVYRSFLETTGYSADGLAAVSNVVNNAPDLAHPYAWFSRRERDMHDIWHVLTSYEVDDELGEACLVAFSYAQSKGLGWAAIAVGVAIRSIGREFGSAIRKAIWEGYRNGLHAAWLSGEDCLTILDEPLAAARQRLGIREPVRYHAVKAALSRAGA